MRTETAMEQSVNDTTPKPAPDDSLLSLAFAIQSNPGAYALILGAGVSAGSGLPTAWEVLEDLALRVANLVEQAEPNDPVAWYESRFDEPARYGNILERLGSTPAERQGILRRYFEPEREGPDSESPAPTIAHESIARLASEGVIRVIVTLNFDRLVETALRNVGLEPTVVSTEADAAGLGPLHSVRCCVIHLHGDYLNADSMLNTTTELASYGPSIQKLLSRVVEDYGLIISGWSSDYDPALRATISERYPRRFSMAWMDPNQQSELGADLLNSKNGVFVQSSAEEGFSWLVDAVTSLREREARHPLTVSVAVETAKRELAGRWVAINLHDQLKREFAALLEISEFHLSDYGSAAANGGYEPLVDRVQEATRVCAALVSTLAYWGNTTTDAWWAEELVRFARAARGSGEVRLLALRQITGCVLLYSAGISAAANDRFDLLARILSLRSQGIYDDEMLPVSRTLAADAQYPGLDSPLEKLKSVVDPILRESMAIGPEGLESAWQEFELLRLGSLVCADKRFVKPASTVDRLQPIIAGLERESSDPELDDEKRTQVSSDLAKAKQSEQEAIDLVAALAHVGRPHLLMLDRGPDSKWQNPIATQLIQDLMIEGDQHPMIVAAPAFKHMATALRGLQDAASDLANEMQWNLLPAGGAGFLPDDIWLDTGKSSGSADPYQ